jgi:PEP-CTERM motif
MRMKLLLILVLGIAAMGADCGGGSSHSSPSASSSLESGGSPAEGGGDSAPAAPEPSALLVFGTGLLLAGAATRRSR